MQIHSVNSEGLQRLLFLMEGSHWLNNNRRVESPSTTVTTTNNNNEENSENNEDQRSKESLGSETPTTTESTPLGTISEKHVYKYRCAQCSLAFKTAEKLALHSQYHVIRDSTKCRFCSRSFRSVQALLKHLETSQCVSQVSQEELAHYKLGLMNHPLLMAGLSGQLLDSNTNDILRRDSSKDNSEESMDLNATESTNDNTSDHEGSTSKKSLLSSTFSRGKAGDKNLNYPLEKYLDPNRPYKCDVCKESFTQKNILLVHYNSVSHLHRLKKTMQDQQKENSTPESKSPPARMTSLETALNNLANAKQIRDMDEGDKPYKCNICKVSYNQGSTLDIHVRSVLHQTRASKLQDLALSGQIDFSKPLIEQPDSKQLQEQHKKILQDMLSPKSSFNSSNSSNQSSSNSPPPVSPQLLNLQQVLLNAKQQQDNNVPEQAPPQQQLLQFLQNISNNMNTSENSPSESPRPAEEQMKNLQQTLAEQVGRKPNSAVKNLLENYGFELVMQFKRDEEERRRKEKESEDQASNAEKEEKMEQQRPESVSNETNSEEQHPKENNIQAQSSENEKETENEEELKSNLDNSVESEELESSPIKKPANNPTCSTFLTPEKSSEDERSTTFPETSTPKSRSSTPAAASVSEQSNESKPTLPKELADFSSNFQKVMMNAQQQSQGINPMLLQMAQFQGMNPLVAMNLHPPLIPPSILQAAQQNSQGNSSNQNGGITSGMMKTNDTNEAANQQMQLMMKLGIDPKILAQSGIDPKFFMQMSQLGANGPKMPDPNLLALFGNQQQQQQPPQLENVPDPKLLFQMMQMGNNMPGQPDPKLLLQLAQLGKDGPMGMDKPGFPGLPGFDNRVGQPLPMGQKPVFPQPEQTKRARTRITDDQLKVLRSNFDINNSPTEEQIMTMAGQTGLPPKVIKHWFRNTLFKERQKNKDSPYNFNNPPSTMLNLEEYERTGEPKVIALKPEEQKQYTADQQQQNQNNLEEQAKNEGASSVREASDKHQELRVKNNEELLSKEFPSPTTANSASSVSSNNPMIPSSVTAETSSIVSSPSLTLSSILSSQMGSLPKPPGGFLPNPLVPNFPVPTSAGMASVGRLPEFLNPLANMMANEQPQRSPTPQGQPPSGGPGGHQGKRANRTRFTDYQIKVLQEFFENNAYPKDDDLEYLSKLLSLSPRVIVVWFQNARQKARKIYENQPPLDPNDDGAGRFTRTPGLNYQCKKCLLVFQRYYELIRHQKQHCFKEEDAKRSAQAQKAAAQAAAQFNNQQIGGPSSVPSQSSGFGLNTSHSDDSNSSTSHDRTIQSPMFNHNFGDKRRSIDENDWGSEPGFSLNRSQSSEEEKKITPSMFDQLAAREGPPPSVTGPGPIGPTPHQGLFPKLTGGMAGSTLFPSYPPSSPFGILQQQALQQSKNFGNDRDSDDFDQFDTESVGSSPSSGTKRKHSEDVDLDDKDGDQPRDKRLRTTILPEQLDYLYQKYQIESNPSRKMLEQIANEVGLRKRVVQVWFQNTRARERKGQFRAHQQVINKRCPFCPAIFRVRSALESHLATKHADHYTRGEIDIDALPDAEGGSFLDEGIGRVASSKTPPSAAASLPPLVPSASDQLHSMQKYYEDTMKRYMNDLQVSAGNSALAGNSVVDQDLPQPGEPNNVSRMKALDLSTPPRTNDSYSTATPSPGYTGGPTVLEISEDLEIQNQTSTKRFRTQMSHVQIKLMKSVFNWYKTPTMPECYALGEAIGLPKRVVQVWFQNARAKDKKAKLQQFGGLIIPDDPVPTHCDWCQVTFQQSSDISNHLFHSQHLSKVRQTIEQNQETDYSENGFFDFSYSGRQCTISFPFFASSIAKRQSMGDCVHPFFS